MEFEAMRQNLPPIQTQVASLDQLTQYLPRLLSNLSIGRAQIAMEQIRSALAVPGEHQLAWVTAGDAEQPIAAAVAYHPRDPRSGLPGETATIVHAGMLEETAQRDDPSTDEAWQAALIGELSAALDRELRRRGGTFVQWATDVLSEEDDCRNDSISRWCRGFGFQSLASLDYLSGPIHRSAAANGDRGTVGGELHFAPLPWNQPGVLSQFAAVVEQTYEQTQDCPRLADYRSARQTLDGYQTANSFDDRFWFTVHANEHSEPVGCLVLATHGTTAPSSETAPSAGSAKTVQNVENGEGGEVSASIPSAAVVEIVYMGLIPQARGNGFGRELFDRACLAAAEIDARRIILAVDQNNHPARSLYQRAGLQWMLSERIWAKAIAR